MPDMSPRLSLPYIQPAQAQKHVTHNAALERLDALVQLSVLARDHSTPPTDPAEGSCYIVATDGQGAWDGQDDAVASFQNGTWLFLAPEPGWAAYIVAEALVLRWDGTAWGPVALDLVPQLGINSSADASNRLAVAAPASLFSHEGAGHQLKVNKASTGDTASLLFQSGWSGRAEMGLIGGDEFAIKTSSDGVTWTEALRLEGGTGTASGTAVQTTASDVTPGRLARADFVYGPGNLLGVVGQSGGLPTGAMIEAGSNANGEYARFADGTQICWRNFANVDVNLAVAGLYKSGAIVWTFPALFASSAWSGGGRIKNSSSGIAVHLGGEGANNASAVVAWAAASVTGRDLELYAVGRWF